MGKRGQATLEVQPQFRPDAAPPPPPLKPAPPPPEHAAAPATRPPEQAPEEHVSSGEPAAALPAPSGEPAAALPAPPGGEAAPALPAPSGGGPTVTLQASASGLTSLSLEHKLHFDGVARCSVHSMVTKRWRPAFVVLDRPELLLVFRSREDYTDYLFNSQIRDGDRKWLVKKAVPVSFRTKTSPVVTKRYPSSGFVCYFTVSEIRDIGTVTVCKIGGQAAELAKMRHAINVHVRDAREARERRVAGATEAARPPPPPA